MNDITPTLRIHLWLETGEGMLLGLGRAELLLRIQECGSLNRAAKAMGMSYRAAWGRLKATENQVGEPLVEPGQGRKGFTLSPLGPRLAQEFKAWHAEVEAFALDRASKMMPWTIRPFTSNIPGGDDGEDSLRDDA